MKRRSEDSKRSLALQGQLRCGPGAGFRQPAGRAGCDSAETLGRHGQGAGADHALAGALPGDRRERVDAGEAGGDPLENRACLAPWSASALCKTGRTQQKPGHRPWLFFHAGRQDRRPPSGHGALVATGRDGSLHHFAPRTRIQARTGQAGDFHGQQIVAGGDARAALMHDGGRIAPASSAVNSARNCSGALKRPSVRRFSPLGRFSAPGCGRPPGPWVRPRRDSGWRARVDHGKGGWAMLASTVAASTVAASDAPGSTADPAAPPRPARSKRAGRPRSRPASRRPAPPRAHGPASAASTTDGRRTCRRWRHRPPPGSAA